MSAPDVTSTDRGLALGVPPAGSAATVRHRRPAHPALTAAPGLAYFEECPDAILRFNAQRRVVYANPAVERATAVSRWRVRRAHGSRMSSTSPSSRRCGTRAWPPCWRRRKGAGSSFRIPHPTGTEALRCATADRNRGRTGAHLHVTAVLRDITVPKSAMRATRAAAEFVEELLASASIGIGVLDRECVYRVWNEHLEDAAWRVGPGDPGQSFTTRRRPVALAGTRDRSAALAGGATRTPVEVEARVAGRRAAVGPGQAHTGVRRERPLRWRVHHGRTRRS